MSGKKVQSPHVNRKAEILEAVERILDVEGRLNAQAGEIPFKEKADLLNLVLMDYFVLSRIAPMTGLAFDEVLGEQLGLRPTKDGAYTIEEWRTLEARKVLLHLPLTHPSARYLSQALLALNKGEVRPVVQKSTTGSRNKALTLRKLQLLAFMHSHWLQGNGYRSQAAWGMVADAYGLKRENIETVRSWSKRELRDAYGREWLEKWKTLCREIGSAMRGCTGYWDSYASWLYDLPGEDFDCDSELEDDEEEEVASEEEKIFEEQLTEQKKKIWESEKTLSFEARFLSDNLSNAPLPACGEAYRRAMKGEDVPLPNWIEIFPQYQPK